MTELPNGLRPVNPWQAVELNVWTGSAFTTVEITAARGHERPWSTGPTARQ